MTFADNILNQNRPDSIRQDVALPRRQSYYPSPADWRDEILYFLPVDRFSDGQEATCPPLDRGNLIAACPKVDGAPWRWDRWAESGGERWQGGTLQGVQPKLGYLKSLDVTTIWLSPVFKQRGHLDTYHGYGTIFNYKDEGAILRCKGVTYDHLSRFTAPDQRRPRRP